MEEQAAGRSASAEDHFTLQSPQVVERYFRKFETINSHLGNVAAILKAEGHYTRSDIDVISRYLYSVRVTFHALWRKFQFSGRSQYAKDLTFDRVESGFPIAAELMEMAVDAQSAAQHLEDSATPEVLKEQMVEALIRDLKTPERLQFAMSQRLYYEELAQGNLFWPRQDVHLLFQEHRGDRRAYMLHWAVYDSQLNLPTIYLMELEDSGRVPLPKDERRWPRVQTHLQAQSSSSLKLITIARGFDSDFDDLHPKRLRRIFVGPMYSNAFTRQTGPIRDVLRMANAPAGEDWAFVWSEETLESERVERVKSGWFGSADREVFALDPFAQGTADAGITRMDRFLILPERPYHALAELDLPGFRDIRKFVVNAQGRVLQMR